MPVNTDAYICEARVGRRAWVQVVDGAVVRAGERLQGGDGGDVTDAQTFDVRLPDESEACLFGLPVDGAMPRGVRFPSL